MLTRGLQDQTGAVEARGWVGPASSGLTGSAGPGPSGGFFVPAMLGVLPLIYLQEPREFEVPGLEGVFTTSSGGHSRHRGVADAGAILCSHVPDPRTTEAMPWRADTSQAEVHRSVRLSVSPAAHSSHVAGGLPVVSVVWSLVESQRVRSARDLLASLPDQVEYREIRRILQLPSTSVSSRIDGDRRAEYAWLSQHAGEYAGQWVAVSGDSLVGTARTLRALRRRLAEMSPLTTPPLLHFVE